MIFLSHSSSSLLLLSQLFFLLLLQFFFLLEKTSDYQKKFQKAEEERDQAQEDFRTLEKNNDELLQTWKKEHDDRIREVNERYQELISRKNGSDEQVKELLRQNKELTGANIVLNSQLQEKKNKIIDMELKMASQSEEYAKLLSIISAKDQTIFRLKTNLINSPQKNKVEIDYGEKQEIEELKNRITELQK